MADEDNGTIYVSKVNADSNGLVGEEVIVELKYVSRYAKTKKLVYFLNLPIPDAAKQKLQNLGGVYEAVQFNFTNAYNNKTDFLDFIDNVDSLIGGDTNALQTFRVPYLERDGEVWSGCMVTELTYYFEAGQKYVIKGSCTLMVGDYLSDETNV